MDQSRGFLSARKSLYVRKNEEKNPLERIFYPIISWLLPGVIYMICKQLPADVRSIIIAFKNLNFP